MQDASSEFDELQGVGQLQERKKVASSLMKLSVEETLNWPGCALYPGARLG